MEDNSKDGTKTFLRRHLSQFRTLVIIRYGLTTNTEDRGCTGNVISRTKLEYLFLEIHTRPTHNLNSEFNLRPHKSGPPVSCRHLSDNQYTSPQATNND